MLEYRSKNNDPIGQKTFLDQSPLVELKTFLSPAGIPNRKNKNSVYTLSLLSLPHKVEEHKLCPPMRYREGYR